MGGIFISYRREDSITYAGRLYDRLVDQFGDDRIFMDIDTMKLGSSFVKQIEDAVTSCDVLIALIGRNWLQATNDKGQRRLDDAEDVVRIEIKTALDRNVRVIPVLVGGATMPEAETLPDALRGLARRHAIEISDKRFHPDMDTLIASLKGKGSPKPRAGRWGMAAGILGSLIVVVVVLLVILNQPAKELTGKDGAPMVVISAGKFWMGSSDGDKDEHPRHEVELDAFYIDTYEVTTSHYRQFINATGQSAPEYWDQVDLSRDGDKPVVGISWHDAKAYCAWAGKRLPTEAEWEKAARGTEGRKYPWGNEKPTPSLANFEQSWAPEKVYAKRLHPVGSHEAGKTPEGVHDMAGNAWEWVADWSADDYYSQSPHLNPMGPSNGMYKVLRGGSWDYVAWDLRSANRLKLTPTERYANFGVRCAKDAR